MVFAFLVAQGIKGPENGPLLKQDDSKKPRMYMAQCRLDERAFKENISKHNGGLKNGWTTSFG